MTSVMGVAPRVWALTTREPAATVPRDHRTADRGGDDWRAATDVQRLGPSGQHHPHHRRVTGEATRGLGGDRTNVIQIRGSSTRVSDHLGIDGHRDVWAFASHTRPIREIEPLPTDLPQGVGSALRGCSDLILT